MVFIAGGLPSLLDSYFSHDFFIKSKLISLSLGQHVLQNSTSFKMSIIHANFIRQSMNTYQLNTIQVIKITKFDIHKLCIHFLIFVYFLECYQKSRFVGMFSIQSRVIDLKAYLVCLQSWLKIIRVDKTTSGFSFFISDDYDGTEDIQQTTCKMLNKTLKMCALLIFFWFLLSFPDLQE